MSNRPMSIFELWSLLSRRPRGYTRDDDHWLARQWRLTDDVSPRVDPVRQPWGSREVIIIVVTVAIFTLWTLLVIFATHQATLETCVNQGRAADVNDGSRQGPHVECIEVD